MATQDINPTLSRPNVADWISEADLVDPTKAEILADSQTGLRQTLAGEGRLSREALAEIRCKESFTSSPARFTTAPTILPSG